MLSNYTTLRQYYKNQNSSENFSEYNVGKFEIAKTSKTELAFKIINSDISNDVDATIYNMPLKTLMTIKADKLPDNFEIKSVQLFVKDITGKWGPVITPFIFEYLTYDSGKKEIYFGKVGFKIFQQLIYLQNENNVDVDPLPMARFYITW